jgi:hypothetical protein
MSMNVTHLPAKISREARILLLLGSATVLISILMVWLYQQSYSVATSAIEMSPIDPADRALLIRPDSPRQGPVDASITLVT